MTLAVGIALLLVFVAFAALMFLERLSALLALPLMAVVFLLVAVCADLAQPPEVTELVSRAQAEGTPIVVRSAKVASRFQRWLSRRALERKLLAERSAAVQNAIERVSRELSVVDDTLEQRLVFCVLELERDADKQAEAAKAQIGSHDDPFSRPPLYAGAKARFEDAYAAIALPAHLKSLFSAALADPPESVVAQTSAALDELRRAAASYPSPTAELGTEAPAFKLAAASSYLLEALFYLFRAGSLSLYATIIATIFGGMFALYVKNLKVAERMVYWAAEYSGERPLVITLAIFLVTAGIFTSVGGLGTVIMIGTIILPVLRSIGISPVVAAGTFLIAIAMGGTLQPVSRRLWMDFYGVSAAELDGVLWTMVGLYAACGLGWIVWGTRRGLLSSFHFEEAGTQARRHAGTEETKHVPARLMIAPLVPVALVYFGGVEEISAFTLSIAYMFLCVARRPGSVRILARSLIEGAQTVMPPVLLMIGIGMLFTSVSSAPVQAYLRPILALATPETRWGYIAVFALGAPLALYRGPLNVWGMGLAVSATLLATSALPPTAILCAVLAAGMLQGICDPTNTANVWVASFLGISANQILRFTIVPVWLAATAAIAYFGFRLVGA